MSTHRSSVKASKKQGGIATGIIVAMLVALLLALTLIPSLAAPAKAQEADQKGLTRSGPIDPSNGYPYWYEDETGLKLDLCLDPQDDMCLQPFEMPNPEAPVSFPENFPGEAFWWIGEAQTTTNTGGDALLSLALESAWGGDESVRDGSQISFGRIRIRVDDLAIGSTYRVTHPYGVKEFVAEDDGKGAGEINFTEDLGCLTGALAKCDFDEVLAGNVGPFLTWDTFGGENDDSDLRGPNGEPNAYVGDPNTPHTVTGSPIGTNFFKVEELDGAGNWVTVAETHEFTIAGKVAGLQIKPQAVGADRSATVFNDANQKIKLVSSDPEAEVYYTTDGSPATEQSMPYVHSDDPNEGIILNSDPNALTGTKTQLNYVAIKDGQRYEGSKTFEVDLLAPNLTVSEPAGTYDEASKDIEFTTNERARVYYTTDGSNPRDPENPGRKSFVYDPNAPTPENVVHFDRSQTIRAIAVDLDPANNDAEVNWGQPRSYEYILSALKAAGPVNPLGGYPYWYEDHNGLRLDLCLDPNDQKCLQPFESPDPTAPVSFLENFPGEAFWWTGEAELNLPGSKKSLLSMAHEAAWGGADEAVRDGDQIVFGRIRVRIDGLQLGQQYRVSHPYGTDTYVAEDDGKGGGEINVTEDLGCGELGPVARCDYNEARFGRVGPFLTWDTFGEGTDENLMALDENGQPDPSRSDAYVGDPNVEHAVKGSPVLDEQGNPQNYFKLEHNNGGNWETVGQTDLFSVSGKVSNEMQVGASQNGGLFNEAQQITLTANEPGARIIFTTDGTDPAVGDGGEGAISPASVNPSATGGIINGTEYTGPITISKTTELRYIAVTDANTSRVFSQKYTIDTEAPRLSVNPEPGLYNEAQQVTLIADNGTATTASARAVSSADDSSDGSSSDSSVDRAPASSASDNKLRIHYTTNGSEPTLDSTVFEAPIRVDETMTIRALAVDAAGNHSAVASFKYTIQSQAPTALTLNSDSRMLDLRKTATLSGQLTASERGDRLSDREIVLLRRPIGEKKFSRVPGGLVKTDAQGNFSKRIRPDKNTVYRAHFAGGPEFSSKQSSPVRVNVRAKVTNNTSTKQLNLGQRRAIVGRVLPAHKGKVVKVTIKRPGKDVVRNLRLNRSSSYRFVYKANRVGRHTVIVRFAGDADHRPSAVTKSFRVVQR